MVTSELNWILIIITIATCIQLIPACPVQCTCQETNQTSHVTCAYQSLTRVPGNIPTTVTYLDLRGNNISSLAKVFQNFTQVQIIDLSFNNISAIDIEDLEYNANLEHLNLTGNSISHIKAKTFQNLTKLISLNIANNSISSSLSSAIFYALFNLETLQLQGNLISTVPSDVLLYVDTLIQLDLGNNVIKELPPNLFANQLALTDINLRNNLLTYFDGQSLGNNTAVKTLDLSHNNIDEIHNLTLAELDVLDLSWNNLENISAEYFVHLGNLSSLLLDGNPVKEIKTGIFENLVNLRRLSLSNMPHLSYLSKFTFLGLEQLEELEMRNNRHLSFIHKGLFVPLHSVSIMDLSLNNISAFHNETVSGNSQLSSLDLTGNHFTCNCATDWLILSIQSNDSIIVHSDQMKCVMQISGETVPMLDIDADSLYCSEVTIINHTMDSTFRIGEPAILRCEAESVPTPEITWITPRKRILKYHNFHEHATYDYLPFNDEMISLIASSHEGQSYYSESEARQDRIRILSDGSLFIDFVMRSDSGPYKCIAANPNNSTEIAINLFLDYAIITTVKIWSLIVGFTCAGGFFLLNLIYSLTLTAVRRCISQRRRERIRQIIENMDQYRTAHLVRIKDNYNNQVGRIRDQYHYQLGRLREHHQTRMNRMGRMRDGASQRVDNLRDSYNNQLGRLKDYSSSQLVQLREKYNSQVDKIKDYGNDKFDRLHEKYKMKQQHVLKLLEMMNLENCRTVFESECVRAESMILQSDMFASDVQLHSPSDSISAISGSDSEYVTASSSESSKYSSKENVNHLNECLNNEIDIETGAPMNPYLPDNRDKADTNRVQLMNPYLPDVWDKADTNLVQLMNPNLDIGTDFDEIEDMAFITPTCKPRKYKSKQSRRRIKHEENFSNTEKTEILYKGGIKHEENCSNSNTEKTEILYKGNCDSDNANNEAKEYTKTEDSGQVLHIDIQTGYNAHTNDDLDRDGAHSIGTSHSNPGPSMSESERKGGTNYKHFTKKSSRQREKRTNPDDDVSIDMPSNVFGWTIKESVV